MMLIMSFLIEEPKKRKVDFAQISAAYNAWRLNYVCNPEDAVKHGMFRCPYLSDDDLGGAYVDNDYCKSFCKDHGCKMLKTCKSRLQSLSLRGVEC